MTPGPIPSIPGKYYLKLGKGWDIVMVWHGGGQPGWYHHGDDRLFHKADYEERGVERWGPLVPATPPRGS